MKASDYLVLNWNVMPVGRDKRPLLREWRHLQERRVTPDMLAGWRKLRPVGLAVITGAISGIIVLDSDGPAGEESLRGRALPPTPTVLTGGGGVHRYYRHPGGRMPNAVRLGGLAGVDLRGDGGYVVAPPSLHPSGRRYEWAPSLSPADIPVADPPAWLLDLLHHAPAADRPGRPAGATAPDEWRRLVAGVDEGARNESVARLAGHLLRRYVDPYVGLDLCLAWNEARCRPPLEAAEVERTVRSVAAAEVRRRGGDRRAG